MGGLKDVKGLDTLEIQKPLFPNVVSEFKNILIYTATDQFTTCYNRNLDETKVYRSSWQPLEFIVKYSRSSYRQS